MAAAALFAALALTGCSLLKVAVATGDPLSKEEMNIRTMTRGFYYDMASEVSRTADSIAAAAPDIATRVAAVRWKIRATRAGVSAAMQGIPDVALADMWILCRRMDEGFAAAPDSLLFGAQSDLARDAAARLDRRAARPARPAGRPRVLIRRPAYPTWPLHREKEMEDVQNEHLRNIAINAHIDHGKTAPQG